MHPRLDFLKIIRIIDENQLLFFTSGDLAGLVGVEIRSIQNYLETLANNGLIIRLEKGKYCRTFVQDRFVIGSNIIKGGVVSYSSAMHYHGLIPSLPSKEVYIASDHQKNNKSVLGFNFNFIKIRPHKYFGIQEVRKSVGNYRVTDPEKTLLDCFDLPKYSGSFSDLARIIRSRQFNQKKLVEYGQRFQNLALVKRIAYLSEKFELKEFHEFRCMALIGINEKYSLLDPGGPDSGQFISKWKIRDNTLTYSV